MTIRVPLNLLNELRKRDKMRDLTSILSHYCTSLIARMLDSINNRTLKLLKYPIYGVKPSIFYHLLRNVIMDVITYM